MSQAGRLKRRSLGQITGFLILMSALSRILGYVREIVLTTSMGQGDLTDAFKAAFLIPDVIYLILIGGAFSTAFIPVLSGYVANDDKEDAWEVSSIILNMVLILLAIGIVLSYIFAPAIVEGFIGRGYPPEKQALTIYLTRIMLAQSFFMCLSGLAQGICHVFNQFVAPAVGPLLYNIAIIAIGLAFLPTIGIKGFAYGVVIGSVLNFLVQLPTLWRIGVRYRPSLNIHHPGVVHFVQLALPVILGLSVIYLNTFVTQFLSSFLPSGSITLLNNANRLMQLPVGIFAIAIATAYFPTMANLVSAGDMASFKAQLTRGLNLIFFILLPASVGLAVIRVPMIRALFLQGAFTPHNVETTAAALFYYSIGIIGYSQQQMLNRGFYAVRDTKSAVAVNCFIILINIGLSVLLVGPMSFRGLALAYSLAGLLSMFLLFALLRRKIGPFGGKIILHAVLKISIASAVMGLCVALYLKGLAPYLDTGRKWMQVFELLSAIAIGAGAYIGMALILRIEEMDDSLALVYRKLGRSQEEEGHRATKHP